MSVSRAKVLTVEDLNRLIDERAEEKFRAYRANLRNEIVYERFQPEIEDIANRLAEKKVGELEERIDRLTDRLTRQADELEKLRALSNSNKPFAKEDDKHIYVVSDVFEEE